MKTKILRKIFIFTFIFAPMFFVFFPVKAAPNVWIDEDNTLDENYVGDVTGLGSKDPRAIAATVIKVMLGFLGIIAVIIIMLGGFKWMTAAGNDDQVGEARNLMGAGAVGLLIILASYGLAVFVLNSLISATS